MAKQPMKPECRETISQILGRPFSEEESRRWLGELRTAFRYEAGLPSSKGLTKDQIAQAAAERLAGNMRAKAAKIRQRANLTVIKTQEITNKRQKYINDGKLGYHATARVLHDIDSYILGVQRQYVGRLVDLVDTIDSRFLGLIEDPSTAKAVVKELYGEDSGSALAKKAAQAFTQVAEEQRERFNQAGGDIGDLGDDWRLPQSHDGWKLLNAEKLISRANKDGVFNKYLSDLHPVEGTKELFNGDLRKKNDADRAARSKTAWVDFIYDRIDTSRYVDEDGKPLNEPEVKEVLEGIFDSIVGNGDISTDVSRVAGKRAGFASKHSQHRAIHFKDADSFFEYHQLFAKNPSILGTQINHVNSLARDIGLMEEMGPNPNNMFLTMEMQAEKEKAEHKVRYGNEKGFANRNGSLGVTTEEMWNTLNGSAYATVNKGSGAVWQALRDMQVWGKLGQAFITSLSDLPMYFHATGYDRLPWDLAFRNLLTTWGKSDKEFASRAGLMAESLTSDLCRWTSDNIGYRWTGKLANATMRASLLSGWTDGIRRAMSLNVMATLGRMSREFSWQELDVQDCFQLENAGITELDWKIYRLAEVQKHRGCQMLTAPFVEKLTANDLATVGATKEDAQKAVSRLQSYITSEEYAASLQPDLYTRAGTTRGKEKGTVSGELWRSFMLFKSFPFGVVNKHLMRMEDKGRLMRAQGSSAWQVKASQTGYAASLIIATTLMGYVSNQIKTLIAGKDLEDPTATDTWVKAFTTGGGAGILGDILMGALDDTKYGHSNVLNFMGPIVGSFLSSAEIMDAIRSGKDGEAKIARFLKSNTPFINIWYVKMGLDHMMLNQMNETLSPGYLRRMERKLKKRTGQEFWIKPGQGIIRAPRVAKKPER